MDSTIKKATILIVEDNPMNLKVLDTIVSNKYDTVLATTGTEAIEKAKSNDVDLILLDIMLPELDGYTVCKILKDSDYCKSTPIIFVTALNSHEDELKGLECGGVDFITKPFSAPIVMARIDTHLKLRQRTKELCKLATVDPLTSIANRRAFDENIKLEWKKSMIELTPLSIVMIDADHFKIYNDSYGHQKGDVCIQEIAKAIEEALDTDKNLVARYGGEEFVVILTECDKECAMQSAKRIKDSIYNANIPYDKSPISDRVTVSIGISTCTPSKNIDTKTLIDNADKALYVSKNSGRDKISVKNS
jgi:diguanylate cyclase (GGDEF)-like protein